MRRIAAAAVVVLLAWSGPAPAAGLAASELTADFQRRLDQVVAADAALPGAVMHVDCPALGIRWSGAAGFADKHTKTRLTPQHSVRIASVTKVFVAAAALRLVEQGRLALDAPIAPYLSEESRRTLANGGYAPNLITIRQLLSHTSGLFDFGMAEPYDYAVRTEPQRRWTRSEQLSGAMQWGAPYGPPGSTYSYSDTGYIVLGEIVERASSQPLGPALRSLVGYERLGLASTWLESLEPVPAGAQPRAHQYLEGRDTYDWDPSMDLYGGGGLVSTVDDLARFFRALLTGQVFENTSTLQAMLAEVHVERRLPGAYANPDEPPAQYGLGMATSRIEGLRVYHHGGYWGLLVAYVPELDLAVAIAVTEQVSKARPALLRDVIMQVRAARASAAPPEAPH